MNTNKKLLSYLTILVLVCSSCNDFLQVPVPKGLVTPESIGKDPGLINSAVIGMYSSIDPFGPTSASTHIQAILSDECDIQDTGDLFKRLRVAKYSFQDSYVVSESWSSFYVMINRANNILDLVPSISVSTLPQPKIDEVKAAALLIRSMAYLYLINYFGDVPLVVSSEVNQYLKMSRTPKKEVLAKVISDLREAVTLLPAKNAESSFFFTSKYQAQALLLKALMADDTALMSAQNYAEAETVATAIISGGAYTLANEVTDVANFTDNPEAIFSFYGSQWNSVPYAFSSFSLFNLALKGNPDRSLPWWAPIPTQDLVDSFEENDPRIVWTVYNNPAGEVVPSLNKFNSKLYENGQALSYIRLGEVYLLRAEARIQQNKVAEGIADINVIRQRVGLPALSGGISKEAAFAALKLERRHELLSEGVRWTDIKRWGDADAILTRRQQLSKTDPRITPLADYKKERLLFPIPALEIGVNSNLVQNPGW